MKKILCFFVLIVLSQNITFANTVYDDNYVENPNYVQGNKYLENSQYSSAINEFKKAIRTNPTDTSSLIGLSNSYSMRAAYYNNTVKATDSAISDLKSAIFFLKYFSKDNTFASAQTIIGMENNLKSLENAKKQAITPENRYQNAKIYRTKGEFAAAAYDYYQILDVPEYTLEANTALGDIYKIFNKAETALDFYKKALNISPDNTETHLKLARTYEQLKDFNASLKEYDYALKSSEEKEDILNSLEKIWQKKVDEFPKDAEAHSNLGVVYQKQKRYTEALAEYQKAQVLNPSNLNTKINIATLFQEQKKYDLAINNYDSILKIQPYNAKVLTYKAECLKALNRTDEAIGLYKTALSVDPQNAQIKAELFELLKKTMPTEDVLDFLYKNVQNSPMNANSYYEFAYELHKANKIDDAIVYYLETIRLDNTKADAYVNLSQAYRQKKNYSDAYKIIQKAKTFAPDNEQVQKQYDLVAKEYASNKYILASNAFQSGDYNRAIAEYKQIEPATSDSLIGIAGSYQALSNYQEAIHYYKQAMELDNKNADIPFYVASLYINSNDMNNAKEYLSKSLTLNPLNKQAKELANYIAEKENQEKITNAVILYDNKKFLEAIAEFDEIITNNQDNATVYYYRALCYDALNNYARAIDDYKQTIKYAPEMTIAYYSLGVDYDYIGNYKEAKANYKKYVELSTEDNDYRQYAQKRITEIQ